MASTGFAQPPAPTGTHGPRASDPAPIRRPIAVALLLCVAMAARAGAAPGPQDPSMTAESAPIDTGPIFRVFLTDGRALASYGECAILDNRVVFTLVVGDGGLSTEYQLMSLPVSVVDVERTTRYRDAVRAARYAATRGEADYGAMTSEVSRTLDELRRIQDPQRRLEAAEEARRRLLAWSAENYHYRAKDIQELARLFDEVITELKVAVGDARLSLDLVAGPATPPVEPLRAAPSLRESIALALAAAGAADVSTDRSAILHAAAAVSTGAAGVADLSAEVTRQLDEDGAAIRATAALRDEALARARQALARGDIGGVTAVRADAAARALGLVGGRADAFEPTLRELDDLVDRTRAHRLALDHYAMMRPQLLAYERAVRPALSTLEGAAPVLDAIHDMRGPAYATLVQAERRLARLDSLLATMTPPEDLADVHATLVSAWHLALEACKRRRTAVAANDMIMAGEASASAAGAGMLADQARRNLVTRLYPPQVR